MGPISQRARKSPSCPAPSYSYGRLRLVEFSPRDPSRVRDDFGAGATDSPLDIGPKAIYFYVADPIQKALQRVTAAGYPARSAPRKHVTGHTLSEKVVITGPTAYRWY